MDTHLEDTLLTTIERGLNNAIADMDGVSIHEDGFDSITRQKLIILAIEHFDLEEQITVRWYLDGKMAVQADEREAGPMATSAGVNSGTIPSVDDVEEFYRDEISEMYEDDLQTDLKEIIERNSFEFLREYYQVANAPFLEIYLYNLDIFEGIREIGENITSTENAQVPEEACEDVADGIDGIKRELIRYPNLSQTPLYFNEFRKVVCSILTDIKDERIKKENDELPRLMFALNDFYYQAVWRPVASIIAYKTVKGPREERQKTWLKAEIQSMHLRFAEEFDHFRKTCYEYGVDPDGDINNVPELHLSEREEKPLIGRENVATGLEDDPFLKSGSDTRGASEFPEDHSDD